MDNQAKRYLQIYTGNGKGKTTAAIGQAVRAAGSRLKSLIIMFMKDFPYGEIRALGSLADWITIERYGNDSFVFDKRPPNDLEKNTAPNALRRAEEAIDSGKYDLVILDEVCVTTYFGLLSPEDLLPLLDNRPESVELILTGRYCPPEWIERADLVTEMTEVRHYYTSGVLARKGFES
ncbi:MAG: cob(I)yrinic acid a,c-diamide adenosyltransferase [candidate division Zixibacteria bacterium]|nr:cob(I)yrinic acid a,c-diamide adenosyltransferase [candidate division Zixibacteria bacterium]